MCFSGMEEPHSAEAHVVAINVHEIFLTITFEENKAMY